MLTVVNLSVLSLELSIETFHIDISFLIFYCARIIFSLSLIIMKKKKVNSIIDVNNVTHVNHVTNVNIIDDENKKVLITKEDHQSIIEQYIVDEEDICHYSGLRSLSFYVKLTSKE